MLDASIRKLHQQCGRFTVDVAGQVGDVADEEALCCFGIRDQRQPMF